MTIGAGELPEDERVTSRMTSAQLGQLAGGAGWSWLTPAAGARPVAEPPGRDVPDPFPRAAAHAVRPGGGPAPAAAARGFARATLAAWGATDRLDDTVLVLSEILANALRHTRPSPGRWGVAAGLCQPGAGTAVLCAVTDPGPGVPRLRDLGLGGESGRGLQIVSRLSDQWGHTLPGPAGKIVWAVVGPALPRRHPPQLPGARRGPVTDPALLARVLRGLRAL